MNLNPLRLRREDVVVSILARRCHVPRAIGDLAVGVRLAYADCRALMTSSLPADGGQVEFTNFGISTILTTNRSVLQTDGKIVECSWNKDKKSWIIDRVRTDKTHANSLHTAQNVHKSITDGIKEDRLYTMIRKRRLDKKLEARKVEQRNMKRKREEEHSGTK